jgi:putative DNA primase/helicase
MPDSLRDRTRGRWRDILISQGISSSYLNGKNGPCPMCGGTDRWRFTDFKGDGHWICNQCGQGNGFDLLREWQHFTDFKDVAKAIEATLPGAAFAIPAAEKLVEQARERMGWMWRAAKELTGLDLVCRYLRRRGIDDELVAKSEVKLLPPWQSQYGDKTKPAAMVARFVAPDLSRAILHRTYVEEPGVKAAIAKPKTFILGAKIPEGGAVRLMPYTGVLGLAEGIETALSAAQLHGVPVWAALDARSLMKFKPPPNVNRVMIFADRDENQVGQQAAAALAKRLERENMSVEILMPKAGHKDWNDQLRA